MKQFVNELYYYELTWEVKIEESEEKLKDVTKPLVSCEISDEEEIETIVR